MLRTLIIHPDDRSTDFLKPIYERIPFKTIITGTLKQEQVHEEIDKHDRIIMMGHGCPLGLFSTIAFYKDGGGLIISEKTVKHLRFKDNIFIWCNADKFVKEHKLGGLYSGMFISEVSEAVACDVKGVDQNIVNESNNAFATIMCNTIHKPSSYIQKMVLKEYGKLAETNPVAYYNVNRIYVSYNEENAING